MACNCKRVRTYKELEEAVNENRNRIRVSSLLKLKIFIGYLLFTIKGIFVFGYNLFRYDDLRQWTEL